MTTLFYDRLIVLEGLDKKLKKLASNNDELQELWMNIEELIHHRVLGCVLEKLPRHHHEEFLGKFHTAPHDEKLLSYLNEKIEDDVEKVIKQEVKKLHKELLQELNKKKQS